MENLILYQCPYPKKRLGKQNDGGYVIAELPGTYDYFISGGISNDISFEEAFVDKYPTVPCLAFDGTIHSLPFTRKNISFIKKNLGRENSDHLTNLKVEMEPFQDIFLKIDIEGHEFRLLPTFSESSMKKFKQMVVEFHSPSDIKLHPDYYRGLSDIDQNLMFTILEKINQTHTLIHFHANNGPSFHYYDNILFPNVFECTYIRNDFILDKKLPNKERLPTSIDMPNILHKTDYQFSSYPFVSS